jgi:hypothetical protein
MAVLAVATEANHVEASGGGANLLVTDSPAGCFESAVSRCAFDIDTTHNYALPTFTATTDVWVHYVLYRANASGERIIWQLADGTNGDTNGCFRMRQTDATTMVLQYYTGGAWTDVGTITGCQADTLETYDVHINIGATETQYRVWRGGSSVLNTSTNNSDEFSNVDRLHLADPSSSSPNTSSAQDTRISQVCVADEATVNWKVATLFPNADGTYSDWTGNYSNIDEFDYNPDTNDALKVTDANRKSTFDLSDVDASLSSYTVKDVWVGAHIQNNAASTVTDMQFVLRTNGSDFNSSNVGITKDGQVYRKGYNWAVNPDTGQPWTIAELNALEIGIQTV